MYNNNLNPYKSNYEAYRINRDKNKFSNVPKYGQFSLPEPNYNTQNKPEYQVQSQITQNPKYSKYLPKTVLNTLNNKQQILNEFDQKCQQSKEKIDMDVDDVLKQVILLFEDYKHQLYEKVDEHKIGFHNLVDELDKLSLECTNWGEEKIREVEQNDQMRQSVDDSLYGQISEARLKKQKADEIEKALLAFKQKIDQMRLNELNNDVVFLMDNKNPDIYMSNEAIDSYQGLQKDIENQIQKLNTQKMVRPFILDKKVVTHQKTPSYKFETQGKKSDFNIDNFHINQTPIIKAERTNLQQKPITPTKQQQKAIIAQQNHFLSDQIDLQNPVINLEREILINDQSKITNILSLTKSIVLLGNDSGNFLITDIDPHSQFKNQLRINAHQSAINITKKTNENLVLSSAKYPDQDLKLWDMSGLQNLENPSQQNQQNNRLVLMLAQLKGHSSEIIGHDFLQGRILISIDKMGYVNIWDWKISTPIHSMKLNIDRINCFVLYSNKEGFVVSNEQGLIQSYNIIESTQGFEIVKVSEMNENQPITNIQQFRGNNDLIIVTLMGGDVKFVSQKTKMNLNTIIGCKSPLSFLILTCFKENPDVYLLAAEPYGFKIADVDSPEFKYVNTNSQKNFRFECSGFPNWQIVDSISNKKIFFLTVNHAQKPNGIILWSISSN